MPSRRALPRAFGEAWYRVNLRERVDGSPGAPDGLWMDFDHSTFTVDAGWEGYRESFTPAGDFTVHHNGWDNTASEGFR